MNHYIHFRLIGREVDESEHLTRRYIYVNQIRKLSCGFYKDFRDRKCFHVNVKYPDGTEESFRIFSYNPKHRQIFDLMVRGLDEEMRKEWTDYYNANTKE